MLRKILKVFLVIVFIGFISAYVRGIHYNSNKLKNDKSVAQENIETEKQNIIDEELNLMRLRRKIDTRIEPHLIRIEDYKNAETPFIQEVIDTGIKVA